METEDSDLATMVATVVSGVTLALGLSLLALNVSFFWVVFPIGFGAVLPVAMSVTEYYEKKNKEDDDGSETEKDALEELKRKFVNDEISEGEFDRRVEKLVGTETVEDAKEYVKRSGDETTSEQIDKNAEVEKETN